MKMIYREATTPRLGNEMNKAYIEFYSFLKKFSDESFVLSML